MLTVIGRVRTALALLFVTIMLFALAVPALAADGEPFPEVIHLPNGFSTEGIATGRGTTFFAGNLWGGAIYRGDYRTGQGEVISPVIGPTANAVGMKVDLRTNYLFVAAGGAGARVYDGDTGALVQAYPFPASGSGFPHLVNDVALTQDAAYFTDSCSTVLYRLPLGPGGSLPDPSGVEAIPMTGDFQFVYAPLPGYPCGYPNANGIVATANGRRLIINNTVLSAIYLVDPGTGATKQIVVSTPPYATPNADGMLLRGSTLYVVENFDNRIAVLDLSPSALTASVTGYLTSPYFDVPATAAFFGNAIYAVNARFSTPVTPDTEYQVVRVTR